MNVTIKSKKWGLVSLLLLLVLVLALVGCSKDNNQSSSNPESNVTAVDAELVAIGERTAKSSCLPCHGRNLEGDMGPNLHNLPLTDEQIKEVLKKGKGSMPPSTAKGNEEAVIAYLRTLK